jgi:hypothetical protein
VRSHGDGLAASQRGPQRRHSGAGRPLIQQKGTRRRLRTIPSSARRPASVILTRPIDWPRALRFSRCVMLAVRNAREQRQRVQLLGTETRRGHRRCGPTEEVRRFPPKRSEKTLAFSGLAILTGIYSVHDRQLPVPDIVRRSSVRARTDPAGILRRRLVPAVTLFTRLVLCFPKLLRPQTRS